MWKYFAIFLTWFSDYPLGKCWSLDWCHLMAKVSTQLLLSWYCPWWFFVIQWVKKWPLQWPDLQCSTLYFHLHFCWTCQCCLCIVFVENLLHPHPSPPERNGRLFGMALFQISLTIISRQERAPLLSGKMKSAVLGSRHSSTANLITVIPFNFSLFLILSWKCTYIFWGISLKIDQGC